MTGRLRCDKHAGAADAIEAGGLAQLAVDLMAGRAELADVVGITDDELEALYVFGHRYYRCGKYEHALSFFRFLCLHRHTDARFWLGLAGASQVLGRAEVAVRAYSLAGVLNSQDPQIPLRAAECFLKLKRPTAAIGAFGDVLARSAGKPEHATFARRARIMLDRLQARETFDNA
ncbi:SycD/LcrH family type III secretion system chaperone [Bradyrhizobium sp. CB3481]|uniref:SycD/LcrH family type III secretion system chaperone n=1 Tax=Bradyrhizobium sp. CB3481 TaxID=3039158 RepID=UPI0024B08049|nr:SycD/LcrH family type III secretion system chaperone [Bradyrhizobium sp. CB3481]WFU14900.1 SycD/LcrH family type III secretion system chaperone [Bradyrhizobium sp. CB3481]